MTLEQLRIFIAVAERQHVTQAARALDIVQSAVSNAISALEENLGTRLFNRVGRGIELTQAGHFLLVEARALLARADLTRQQMAEFGEIKRGRLHIHASQTIASYWLPRYLVMCTKAFPQVEITLQVGNTAEVARSIHEGTAELGFVEGAVEDTALETRFAARDGFVLVVPPSHPWVQQDKVTIDDFRETDWILREHGSGTRSEFEAALSDLGLSPSQLRVILELPTNEAVRAAVEADIAATVLSASVVAPSLEAGLLHEVPFRLPERAFQFVWHKERHLSAVARAFLGIIPGAEATLPPPDKG